MWFSPDIHCVALVAPAGPLAREKAEAGIAVLERHGIRVKIMPHALSSGGSLPYLSASPEERAADLTAAWLDEETDLILCLRGGYGSAQILPLLDWAALRRRPMPVAGYSDITALHFAMLRQQAGVPVVAPMAGKLAEIENDFYTTTELHRAFASGTREIPPLPGAPYRFLRGGVATGLPLAGNLTVAASLCGTPYRPSAAGRIVILEDLNEPPYKIDRCLTQLTQAGFFDGCAGIALGGFLDCGDPAVLERIFKRLTAATTGPVMLNFPFSHAFPMASLRFDRPLRIGE